MRITTTINGELREVDDVWEGESLLYVLRERMGLPGSKNACEQGECGSCTVYLDGVTCCACLVAAGQADGRTVTTVEGLGGAADLHPVQQAFLAGELEGAGLWESRGELPETLARAFGERVAAAASPIDDVRGSAAYRLHSLSVMARWAAAWAWDDYRKAA